MSRPEPTRLSPRPLWRTAALVAVIASVSFPAFGQDFDLLGGKNSIGFDRGRQAAELGIETALTAKSLEPGSIATLSVRVSIPEGFYLYSMDPGYTGRTRINLVETPGLEPLGEFTADHPPQRAFDSVLNQELEKYTRQVTWTQPLRIVDPTAARVAATLTGTYCSTGEGGLCLRANEKLTATLTQVAAAPQETAAALTQVETPLIAGRPGPATLRFSLAPAGAAAGDTVTLTATMTLGDGWHTYSLSQPKGPGALPTTFTLKQSQGLTPIGETFVADREPHHTTLATEQGETPIEEHAGTVVWSREFRVDDPAYGVEGSIRYITCNDAECLPPKTVSFALGDLDGAGPVPAALPATTSLNDRFVAESAGPANLPLYLGLAFLGGMILNIMPCVLPVVAIKAMSFMHQAGEDRSRVFLLNVVYSIGVISVFLFLAALAALPEWFGGLFSILGLETGTFSWGGLFQSDAFNLIMACLVFAMGLSLLGVFEIPIPGMVGSAAAGAQREGLTGAFLTGIFATLLATPCTGPFMGTALAWSVKQSAATTFLVWGTMGLGMASPYLVFALVPGAVKLLPKPGAWMVQFKQFAGFVLMGTVVWVISSINSNDIVPLLVMLLGIALALWMIGMVQASTSVTKRRLVTAAGIALGLGVGSFGYLLTLEPTHKLAWQPFSTERLNTLRSDGEAVLIDFTADWCANCKVNEKLALNTAATKAFIEQHGVVPLIADATDESEEITQWLDRFGALGVPLTVIFPAGRPNEPIVLDGVYSQSTLLKSLEEAVQPPTVAGGASVRTADAR